MAKPGWMANSVGFYGASGMTGLESPSRNKMNHSGSSPEGKVSEIICAEAKKAHLSMSLFFACLQGEVFTNKSRSKWSDAIAQARPSQGVAQCLSLSLIVSQDVV